MVDEHCPNAPADDPGHCIHWYECEPCHRCGDDTVDPQCDCDRCTALRCPECNSADCVEFTVEASDDA